MANWYGIEGIEFVWRGAWSDPAITYQGVTDTINIDIENLMWEEFMEETGSDDLDEFAQYMLDNGENVRGYIEAFRLAAKALL